MIEVVLTYPTPEGTQEIEIEGDRFSFGRGSDVDYRFEDEGLSRVNSTIYCEGERVWIVDENSTNGTFVNGEKVGASGTPLKDGDEIKIGNHTNLRVRIGAEQTAPSKSHSSNEKAKTVTASSGESGGYFIPIAIMSVAILVIGISALIIGVSVINNSGPDENAGLDDYETPVKYSDDKDKDADNDVNKSEKDSTNDAASNSTSSDDNNSSDSSNEKIEFVDDEPEDNAKPKTILPTGKKYQAMSDAEKAQYIEVKTLKVARMIGNRTDKTIPPAAVSSIKRFLDAYASRVNVKALGGCRFGDNLEVTYRRASDNAHFIIQSFYSEGLDPQIGLYLAMIESEHCVCLQSPTGPLGMFQFAYAAAQENGLNVKKGASPSNPDERCEPEPSSRAAAKYMKKLSGRFGTGPLSIPLAIASYNSGQGALSKNLEAALNKSGSQQRSFWTLVANADNLSKQFNMENIKYVPKFFAAAIVGENPQDFGLNLQPLSTYNQSSK